MTSGTSDGDEARPFDRFRDLAAKLVKVPKSEVDEARKRAKEPKP